jgi:hypothetical protein
MRATLAASGRRMSFRIAVMPVSAVFPQASQREGMYESFYLRAVSPDEPVGVWLRYTVHKAPGAPPRGSLWCTVFDARLGRPFQHKLTTDELSVPTGGWISVGDARLGPDAAEGTCGEAHWSLHLHSTELELRHLPRGWMYRAPLPRTKLTSPAPATRFSGTIEIPGRLPSSTPGHLPSSTPGRPPPSTPGRPPPSTPDHTPSSPAALAPAPRKIELRGWHGMVGHNWGAEHAERWIWLHGIDFEEHPGAWLDVAIGRVRVGRWTTPWVANGALCIDGRRLALGGIGARGLLVAETPVRCRLSLPGAGGLTLDAHVDTPADALAGWSYADPSGDLHDVSNCSIASLAMTVRRPGACAQTLRTAHGAAYELGMREHDHGVPIAPFADG